VYNVFRHQESELTYILKPKVELMVFLRMRSNKITKNVEKAFQVQFVGLISRVDMFFGTRNPRSILKPEVELILFLRMSSNKITKNDGKCL
jgi:hypothetical protein